MVWSAGCGVFSFFADRTTQIMFISHAVQSAKNSCVLLKLHNYLVMILKLPLTGLSNTQNLLILSNTQWSIRYSKKKYHSSSNTFLIKFGNIHKDPFKLIVLQKVLKYNLNISYKMFTLLVSLCHLLHSFVSIQ